MGLGSKHLVLPRKLTAFQLPRIESPFFAAREAKSLVEENSIVRSRMRDMFRYGPHDRRAVAKAVHEAVSKGDLMLVHTAYPGGRRAA